MKKLFLIFNFQFLIFNFSFAQPAIQWQKSLGGIAVDEAQAMQQTSDGGYIIAGGSGSNDGDVTGNHGNADYWVVKLDNSGNIQWQKCMGGTSTDGASSIRQTADGGYVVAGSTRSNDGDVTGNHDTTGSYFDYWVVKLDSSGNLQWQKCLGGTIDEVAYSVQQTTDGGYVVAGYAQSNDGDITGNHGDSDYWVVKLDGNGNLQWQKCLGGTIGDVAHSVQQTIDGGYITAGYANSNNGDVTGNHGSSDNWLVKLDSNGNLQWQKCLGGTNSEDARSIQQTSDGGFITAGYTNSNNGDVTGNHGSGDHWIAKVDSNANLQWQKCLGGTGLELAFYIRQTSDGGYIETGYTLSTNGDVTGNHGATDYWLVKLDSNGNLQWQKCLGGTYYDDPYSVLQTSDGGYIVAGRSGSINGDVTGNHGGYDYWVVKLYPDFPTSENNPIINFESPLSIIPNPFTTQAVISFGSPVYNATLSLYNLLREKVAEATGINGESFEFNRGNLQSGVYIFEVREKEKSITRSKAVVY